MNGETGAGRPGVAVGRVMSPHGVGGFLKTLPLTDFPERCAALTGVVWELKGVTRALTVEQATPYGQLWLMKFAGIDSREEASALQGGWLLIPPEERMALPPGRYYHDQLVGLMVYNMAGECLGRLEGVIPGAAHDHYLVRGAGTDGKEFLLPAVREFVLEIDLPGGRIVVRPPEGLLEL